ncbi:MAG: rfbD [Burkholderiaceae bacterium]|nr:rfbD [Burkholderiaceae bacterium]
MKILLFGGNGQIGHELQRTLAPFGRIVAPSRSEADLTEAGNLQAMLQTQAPDIIVNAAAYTAVDPAESNETTAFAVNATAVETMARYARYNGSLLVHYSTDYVFDGTQSAAYTELDAPNPLNAYGRTKLAGELALQQGGCHALTFRTSWVFSSHGRNFIRTILKLARERETIDVVSDQIGAPTSAELVADVTALALAAFHADALPEGLYHLTASGSTSWYGLACYVVQQAQAHGATMKLGLDGIRAVRSTDYRRDRPGTATRPRNSRLDCSKLTEKLGLALPHWKVHVDRMLAQIDYGNEG